MKYNTQSKFVRVHLTNVAGVGASRLLESLLPALEQDPVVALERIDLPDRGSLATYRSCNAATVAKVYHRFLPNAFSRVLECTCLAWQFDGDSPLLVLGDLPLRCRGPQTVFVQNSILLKRSSLGFSFEEIKHWISRILFNLGVDRVRAFIVQTDLMRANMERKYPRVAGRVHVIPQPVPIWLLQSGLKRRRRSHSRDRLLNLFYPAASYPHKNHKLLSRLEPLSHWPVENLTLTIDVAANPAPHFSWIHCSGLLSPSAMIAAYSQADALLFLSKDESYGFPLLEAMFVGLPIVCPYLPYARTLCGDQAVYFDPDQPESLRQALHVLLSRIEQGWWPDWRDRLVDIPNDWATVARRMLQVACEPHFRD